MKKLIVQNRRGTQEALETVNLVPRDGEIIVEKHGRKSKLKVGDGSTAYKELAYITKDTDDKVTELETRIDNLSTGSSEPSEGSWENEVRDIRAGYDGNTYPSAGAAVRAIGNALEDFKENLDQFVGAEAVDGLSYENSMLQLTASGVPVGNAVLITGGSGGGGTVSTIRLQNKTPQGNNFSVTSNDKVELSWMFISTEDGLTTGDYTCVIQVDDVAKKTLTLTNSVIATVDVTQYLKSDENKVKIVCSDIYDNSRTLVFNINVIELEMKSSFNSNMIYKETEYPDGVDFRYIPIGLIDKTVYFKLDGQVIETKVLRASTSGKELAHILTLEQLSHGSHTFEVYAEAELDGAKVGSNTLRYDLLIHRTGETAPMMGSTIDYSEVTQGELISIPYIVYDPNDATCKITLQIYDQDGFLYSNTEAVVDQTLQTWSTRKYPIGDTIKFVITYHPDDMLTPLIKTHIIKVKPATISVEPEEGALLELTAFGRTNQEENPGVWTSGDITTTFKNFNWKSNGWVQDDDGDTCLRLSGGAKAIINFAPLSKRIFNIQNNGVTIEFEFAIRDVNNRDTTVISCLDYDTEGNPKRGFKFTADSAFIKSIADQVSCNYKDEQKLKVAFTIEKTGRTSAGYQSSQFLCVYLNGVLSKIVRYTSTDFNQDCFIELGDTGCTLDLYTVRVYNKVLTARELTNNYIADITDFDKKTQIYEDNDIYSASGLISYSEIKKRIPVVTFTGQMPKVKGDKKLVLMDFVNPLDHSKDFSNIYGGPIYVLIDVQGTSSQFYVRKNWKVKLKDKKLTDSYVKANAPYQHMDDELPAWVFCFKVDYAEGTGTHNTQNANFVETLYDELVPAQDVSNEGGDSRVRTTVAGFPCVIFEKATEDSEPVFSSKGNFNFDKGAEDAFGFNKNFDVESWELRNNTSDPCNFLAKINPEDGFMDDFEPRYITNSEYSIDDLEDIEDLYSESQKEGGTPLTEEETAKLIAIRKSVFSEFKKLHDWIVDTKDDPQRFKDEFENWFDPHYTSVYYVYTFVALMVDQRAKNMFLTRWKNPKTGISKWYPYFYDNDTSWGINNEGYLTFDYYHEDTDQVNGANVYNGQNSALWTNYRKCFPDQIQATYADLRSRGKLSYDAVINQFINEGSDRWSESIYNEDSEFKYITMARPENNEGGAVDTGNLYQVVGNGESHLQYIVSNRFMFCDSKWYAGDYPNNFIFMRLNTPQKPTYPDGATEADKAKIDAEWLESPLYKSIQVVPPSPEITLTPFSTMYCGVRYKANGTLYQKKTEKNKQSTFGSDISETFNDTETAIYGATELSSVGDLSNCYLSIIQADKATKLTTLKLGNSTPGYNNTMLVQVSVGTNRLLKTLDVTNCSGLGTGEAKSLDVSKCDNIENIYASGTSILNVALPAAGYLKNLQLPSCITELVITNHPDLTDENLIIGAGRDVDNVSKLCIANCTGLNTTTLLDTCLTTCKHLERVRLTNINWTDKSVEYLKKLYLPKDQGGYGLKGIDVDGKDTDVINISGNCVLNENINGETMAELTANLPYIHFSMGEGYKLTSVVKFWNDAGTVVLHTEVLEKEVTSNITCDDPVITKKISTPTKESTAQYTYVHCGWSINPRADRTPQDDALKNIMGDRNLYPAFTPMLRSYTAGFYVDDLLMYEVTQHYGTYVTFDPNKVTDNELLTVDSEGNKVPKNSASLSPEAYDFKTWYPSTDSAITGPTKFIAQFDLKTSYYYIAGLSDFDYKLSGNDLTITRYNNNHNAIVEVPENYSATEYVTVGITGTDSTNPGGFTDTPVEVIKLPDSLTTLGPKALHKVQKLTELTIGRGLTTVNDYSLNSLPKLSKLHFNAVGATYSKTEWTTGAAPFDNNYSDRGVDIDIGPDVTFIGSEMFRQSITDSDRCAINKLDFSAATKCTNIQSSAFENCNIRELILPTNVNLIGSSAFAYNEWYTELTLPEGTGTLDVSAFSYWHKLKKITLPSTVTIQPGAFRYDKSLEEFNCLPGCKYQFTNGCLVDTNNQLIVGTYKAQIPRSISSMAAYAFAGCEKLTNISVPGTIKVLPTDAFAGCLNLETLVLNEGLQMLSQSVFYQCSKLKKIHLPNTLSTIDLLAFGLTPIEKIVIPASVTKFGMNPFLQCTDLKEIWIMNPDGVSITATVEGIYQLFEECRNLTKIHVGWAEGAVPGAEYAWKAPNSSVTIEYNCREVPEDV